MSFHLKSSLPAFVEELHVKSVQENLVAYAAQIAELVVTDRCHCGDALCAEMVCGVDLHEIPLEEEHQVEVLLSEPPSLLVLAFKGQIVSIEVLFRPDVRTVLDSLMPVRPT